MNTVNILIAILIVLILLSSYAAYTHSSNVGLVLAGLALIVGTVAQRKLAKED